jgi:hypothetical protein
MFENTFPSYTRLRVFANWPRRLLFRSATEFDRGEWVHEKRRESNDARVFEFFRHPTRQEGVHRPGEVLISGGSELIPDHVDDVLDLGQPLQFTIVG